MRSIHVDILSALDVRSKFSSWSLPMAHSEERRLAPLTGLTVAPHCVENDNSMPISDPGGAGVV